MEPRAAVVPSVPPEALKPTETLSLTPEKRRKPFTEHNHSRQSDLTTGYNKATQVSDLYLIY